MSEYLILGYERYNGAELPGGFFNPWYYRVENHPENAEGFRIVRCSISKEEYELNHKTPLDINKP